MPHRRASRSWQWKNFRGGGGGAGCSYWPARWARRLLIGCLTRHSTLLPAAALCEPPLPTVDPIPAILPASPRQTMSAPPCTALRLSSTAKFKPLDWFYSLQVRLIYRRLHLISSLVEAALAGMRPGCQVPDAFAWMCSGISQPSGFQDAHREHEQGTGEAAGKRLRVNWLVSTSSPLQKQSVDHVQE